MQLLFIDAQCELQPLLTCAQFGLFLAAAEADSRPRGDPLCAPTSCPTSHGPGSDSNHDSILFGRNAFLQVRFVLADVARLTVSCRQLRAAYIAHTVSKLIT